MKQKARRQSAAPARPRRRRLKRWVRRTLLVAAIALAAGLIGFGAFRLLRPKTKTPPPAAGLDSYTAEGYSFRPEDPNLILLNQNLTLPVSYLPELSAVQGTGCQLTPEAALAYTRMAQAAREEGIVLLLFSGWRSPETEAQLARLWLDDAEKGGTAPAEAAETARTILDVPGAGEHQTGLAADIVSEDHPSRDADFARTDAFDWLCANAPRFGFIQRYPADRQAATGLLARPWHWRYVGTENAAAITQSGLTLEEFLALQTAAPQ